jgi:predicted nucleic acid-binding protein
MMIVLDSSVMIDHLRAKEPALRALATANENGERLVCSVVTKVEVLAGMRPSEEPETRKGFAAVEWIVVDDSIAETAGQLANRYFRSHGAIDPVDYIIAATAIQLNGILWTTNLKHFPMFPGLVAPY